MGSVDVYGMPSAIVDGTQPKQAATVSATYGNVKKSAGLTVTR